MNTSVSHTYDVDVLHPRPQNRPLIRPFECSLHPFARLCIPPWHPFCSPTQLSLSCPHQRDPALSAPSLTASTNHALGRLSPVHWSPHIQPLPHSNSTPKLVLPHTPHIYSPAHSPTPNDALSSVGRNAQRRIADPFRTKHLISPSIRLFDSFRLKRRPRLQFTKKSNNLFSRLKLPKRHPAL